MKHVCTIFCLALFITVPAFAQVQTFDAGRSLERLNDASADGPQVLHITDALTQSAEGQDALAAFHQMKALGLLPAPNKSRTATLGEVRSFRVVNIRLSQFENIDFMLMATHERFNIWVEVAEIDVNISQSGVDELAADMASRTPAGSFNPNAGIIVNDEVLFGAPPNVDGDGKTDILLVDVRDNYNPDLGNNLFVAGFVTPSDLAGGNGNNADVLYLDINPSFTSAQFGREFVAQTAVHEYQHLIHFNYDRNENSFINEGLSEWAESANGYQGRRITYLDAADRYNISLFRFVDEGSLDDRQRGARFISYFADRFGTLKAGEITRNGSRATAGLNGALTAVGAGQDLQSFLIDFHIANYLNDTSLDPKFGFTDSQQTTVRAAPTVAFDGRFDQQTPQTATEILAGGVQYLVWEHVTDLELNLAGGNNVQNLSLTALLFQNGTFEARPLTPGTTSFPGTFDEVTVVAVNKNPDAGRADLTYSATWDLSQQFRLEEVVYDDGIVPREGNTLDAFGLGSGSKQANRYVKPAGGTLTSVSVAPYFDHDFSGSSAPPNAPRNFKLKIWADNGSGIPGDELFSLDVTDGRSSSGPGGVLNFQDIDLSAFQSELVGLPETFYIGLENAGGDNNFLVMGVTAFEGNTNVENTFSFLFLPSFNQGAGAWARFHQLSVSGDPVLQNRVIPIRASFLVPLGPVANDEAAEVPERVSLEANYPNPFNPATTIRYALPQAGEVKLNVYDLLGRQVATLVDGLMPAGTHQVQLDASGWASGLYLYTLEAAGERQTRRMMLVK